MRRILESIFMVDIEKMMEGLHCLEKKLQDARASSHLDGKFICNRDLWEMILGSQLDDFMYDFRY